MVGEQTYEPYDPDRPRTTLDDMTNLSEAVAGFGEAFVSASRAREMVKALGVSIHAVGTFTGEPQRIKRFSRGGWARS